MKNLFRIISTGVLAGISLTASAQQEVEMADTMRDNGKIYVVVAIIAIILAGVIAYLLSLDRKVSTLEKRISEKNK